jgi:hypothetical protein
MSEHEQTSARIWQTCTKAPSSRDLLRHLFGRVTRQSATNRSTRHHHVLLGDRATRSTSWMRAAASANDIGRAGSFIFGVVSETGTTRDARVSKRCMKLGSLCDSDWGEGRYATGCQLPGCNAFISAKPQHAQCTTHASALEDNRTKRSSGGKRAMRPKRWIRGRMIPAIRTADAIRCKAEEEGCDV